MFCHRKTYITIFSSLNIIILTTKEKPQFSSPTLPRINQGRINYAAITKKSNHSNTQGTISSSHPKSNLNPQEAFILHSTQRPGLMEPLFLWLPSQEKLLNVVQERRKYPTLAIKSFSLKWHPLAWIDHMVPQTTRRFCNEKKTGYRED